MHFIGLGGTDEVGASSYLYRLNNLNLLVDAGLRPTMMGEASLPSLDLLDTHPPDLMVITHAHLDHVGALPRVKAKFPNLPVYATRATQRIALEVLSDAVRVGEIQGAPLYDASEALRAAADIKTLTPFEPLSFAGGQITCYPAGHVLGAVGLLIETDAGRVFHTGDFSNIATLTTESAYLPPQPIPVDAVVSEATYGDTQLPGRKDQISGFIEAIGQVVGRGGRVLVPTFALGRAQELVLLLLNHQASGVLPPTPIYLDGLVRTLTNAFEELLELLPAKLQNFVKSSGQPPLLREGVHVVKNKRERMRIAERSEPAVILASSGMLSGGASPVYARHILREVDSALFVVGYQDAESPGRRLLELQRGGEVMLPVQERDVQGFEPVPALCEVSRYYLSAHADRGGILAHLSRYPSPRVVLMHGEGGARVALLESLKKDRQVDLPSNGQEVDLLAETRFSKPSKTNRPAAVAPPTQADTEDALQVRKYRHFKTDAAATVDGQRLVLEFDEEIDLAHLFPEGRYRVEISKGAVTKVKLRELPGFTGGRGGSEDAERGEDGVDGEDAEDDDSEEVSAG
ncbi:MAG: MBL fold metallo-hydrolase [Trueperaceae bacterium]|nr:MBL fold metallo-hydrolase [Trueperaceae bacterium]MDZ7705534.1 MBL fold metallo-hydrolase [Trueperaceae bacterium]